VRAPAWVRAQIANVFVSQYYSVRATQPSSLFRFYTNESTTAWPSRLEWTPPPGGAAPLLELHTGQSAINVKVRPTTPASRGALVGATPLLVTGTL